MMARLAAGLAALAAACSTVPEAAPDHPLVWLSGCWESEAGDYREIWSAPDHGYLFGYALALKEGAPVFFEQMRIDSGEMFVLSAYPAGKGPFPFPEYSVTGTSVVFANPDHDYPQMIAYAREGDRMSAAISLADGSKEQNFALRRCAG